MKQVKSPGPQGEKSKIKGAPPDLNSENLVEPVKGFAPYKEQETLTAVVEARATPPHGLIQIKARMNLDETPPRCRHSNRPKVKF